MKTTSEFLAGHKLRPADIDFDKLVSVFTEEMDKGLAGESSSLRMIPTYIEAENEFLKDTPVLAIDAGGTNFRCALVTFGSDGKIHTGEIARFAMPGIEEVYSAKRFFETIASYIRPMVNNVSRIGFCFSYPTEIYPDKDGRLLQFCKEVQAPGVVGMLIGRTLLETLGSPDKKIVLLNDTVATLLAGKSAFLDRSFDSYIGYILGTGTNTCYIEKNRNILKNSQLDKSSSQIINIESGNFGRAPRTDLDLLFDSTTTDPGKYCFEKMMAGGYFGGICLRALRAAAAEQVFTSRAAEIISGMTELSSEEANDFVAGRENILNLAFHDDHDAENAVFIIDCLIDRAACLAAANIAAVVLKCGRGSDPAKPLLITVEGTAFYRLKDLKTRFEGYLGNYLSGDRKRYYEFAEVSQSSLIGAALAGLTV